MRISKTCGLSSVLASFAYGAAGQTTTFAVPSSVPTSAVQVDQALLSVSLEFFAFPGYMALNETQTCLANIQRLRGESPAVRIGGTTQDRATFDPSLPTPVNFSVASPTDAPDSLTFGPSFFTLASKLEGDVTIGLNRQLNNITNTQLAAEQAVNNVQGLLALELGNEPDLYSSSSPIAEGADWSPSADGASQKSWFTTLSSIVGDVFQGAVYLSFPTWSTAGLIPILGNAVDFVATFSGHAYPQSACDGASTDLPSLMSHSEIASFTSEYSSDAKAAAAVGKRYFLGETNSATCGGGGISPTFGAGLWVMDYTLQGTIGDCAYCFWGSGSVFAPYFGAVFVSEFLGTGLPFLTSLDTGRTAIGAYAAFNSSAADTPSRVLLYNSAYFSGSGSRESAEITLSGISSGTRLSVKRLTASSATALTNVTIGGDGSFDDACSPIGTQSLENIAVTSGEAVVNVADSEAVIVFFH